MRRRTITTPTIDSSAVTHDARDSIKVQDCDLDPAKWSDEKKQFYQRVAVALNDFNEGERN